VDGIPTHLMDKASVIPFMNLIREEITKIKENKSDIDVYGMTNPAEFLRLRLNISLRTLRIQDPSCRAL
jgi:Mlc titration factor MtfA (ptsG expression regulator)